MSLMRITGTEVNTKGTVSTIFNPRKDTIHINQDSDKQISVCVNGECFSIERESMLVR